MAGSDATANVQSRNVDTPIDGHVDPAFAAVEAAFRENFASRDEVGAAVCVRVDGRVVADLWGGHLDRTRTRPWTRDTLVNAYSVGKGLATMLVLSLVERGELDLDEPVERRWPEFAAQGKGGATLRMLMAHQAGLPGVRAALAPDAVYDWDRMCDALASQAPWWTPGEAHGYHVNTHGFLGGELVCRALGQRYAEAFRGRVAAPHDADFHIGLPDAEHARVAPILEPPRAPQHDLSPEDALELARRHFGSGDDEQDALLASVYFNPMGLSGVGTVNAPAWRRASVPSTNGHGTARAVALLYDVFLHGDPAHGGIVGPGLRAESTSIVSDGIDRVLGKPSRFGVGFQLSQPTRRIGGGDRAFGHFGYGGTLGFADPESGVAFGYLMNRPGERWQTPRTNSIVEAVYEALGRPLPPIEDGRPA
jgi:CubicO group peptidase (beta-lactamase class C family)